MPTFNRRPTTPTHLIKVKDQIQLTHIPKKRIQHLHKEMYRLQIRQLVIVRIHTDTEEQSRVAPVDDFRRAELNEVRLVLLVPRRDQAVHFAFELDLLFILLEKEIRKR